MLSRRVDADIGVLCWLLNVIGFLIKRDPIFLIGHLVCAKTVLVFLRLVLQG